MPPHRPLTIITNPLRPSHPLKPHNLHRHLSLHQPRHRRPSPLILLYHQQTPHSTTSDTPRPPHQRRPHSTTDGPPPDPPPPVPYTVSEIQSLSASPRNPRRRRLLIIDVREPAELAATGRIPGALNMPLTSNPDAFYLGDVEFLERFGWEKPRPRRVSRPKSESESYAAFQSEAEDRVATSARESPFTPEMKAREAGSGLGAGGAGKGIEDEEGQGGEQEIADGDGEQGGVEEVVFYCRAGVRSRAAARMAREWKGIKVGDMTGGWLEWEGKGGEVER